ncbi:MAG: hypothetical protein IPJ90_06755 [Anaerolineaceae bacterium]|nr:hypothetical protein [Anaerolineaceae bacterium]
MLFDQALTDTPPEVEQIQIDLLRQAGQARRTQLMLSLSAKSCLNFLAQFAENDTPICPKPMKSNLWSCFMAPRWPTLFSSFYSNQKMALNLGN